VRAKEFCVVVEPRLHGGWIGRWVGRRRVVLSVTTGVTWRPAGETGGANNWTRTGRVDPGRDLLRLASCMRAGFFACPS
jgi:hypothetical protein